MPRIEEMYAFVAEEAEGEGITAFLSPTGWMMPMVGGDMERVDSLRQMARELATASGATIRLLRFSVREELEIIQPGEQ